MMRSVVAALAALFTSPLAAQVCPQPIVPTGTGYIVRVDGDSVAGHPLWLDASNAALTRKALSPARRVTITPKNGTWEVVCVPVTPVVPPPQPPPPNPPPLPPPVPPIPPTTGALFDDAFRQGAACAKAPLTSTGFGWGATATGLGTGNIPDSIFVTSDQSAPSGCVLKMVYQADVDGQDGKLEQHFKVGLVNGQRLKEVFVGFIIKSPANYQHRNSTGPDNNKLLRLWDLSYQASVVHLGMSTYINTVTPGRSRFMLEYTAVGESLGPKSIGTNFPVFNPGTVDTIGYWAKVSSVIGAADGEIKLWHNRKLLQHITGVRLSKPSSLAGAFNGFGHGYLLGWSNSGFTQRTQFDVWRFLIAPAPIPWFLPP